MIYIHIFYMKENSLPFKILSQIFHIHLVFQYISFRFHNFFIKLIYSFFLQLDVLCELFAVTVTIILSTEIY
jgi:hypothetical protein